MKTNLFFRTAFAFYIILLFFFENYNTKKMIKKNKPQNSLSNHDSIENYIDNDSSLNKNNNFIFEKRVENNESSFKISCNLDKDCKDCQMSGFRVKCHENICYCCDSDRKCYCQK